MIWTEITDNFTEKEEHCLISLIANGHDNCFTVKTFFETMKDGFSLRNIYAVIRKLQKKNLCHKIPKNIFSIMWGWLYEPEFEVIIALSFHRHGKKATI